MKKGEFGWKLCRDWLDEHANVIEYRTPGTFPEGKPLVVHVGGEGRAFGEMYSPIQPEHWQAAVEWVAEFKGLDLPWDPVDAGMSNGGDQVDGDRED